MTTKNISWQSPLSPDASLKRCLEIVEGLVKTSKTSSINFNGINTKWGTFETNNAYRTIKLKGNCIVLGVPDFKTITITVTIQPDGNKSKIQTGAEIFGWGYEGIFQKILDGLKEIFSRKLEEQIAKGLICPTCGSELPSDSRFCPNDGTLIGKLCQKCGNSNEPQAKFCKICGEKL